jgi:hypothetical protein
VIRELDSNLWSVDGDRVRMLGIPFDTRMTVVRLADGALWLHSPVAASDANVQAVSGLGPVRHLVAPNKFHHLFVAAWKQRFPEARTWAGPGLAERRREIRFDGDLGDDPEAAWRDDLDQVLFRGSRVLDEAVFLHRASRTAIFTDILQNHDPARESALWRLVKRANGILAPRGGAPRDWRLTVRDRRAARTSLERILAWDFERVILSHGLCVEREGHAFVERAFSWLGPTRDAVRPATPDP